MSKVQNTAQLPVEVLLLEAVSNPKGFIEDMESSGQRQLVASDQIPTDCSATIEQLKAMGFTDIQDKDERDPLFRSVTFPPGWKKVRTGHSMWSDIVDERGRKRAALFYKAAFYDRDASMSFTHRYTIRRNYDMPKTTLQYQVLDAGTPLFTCEAPNPDDGTLPGLRLCEAEEKKLADQCRAWGTENGIPWGGSLDNSKSFEIFLSNWNRP
jgi:hypothetical protein